MNQQKLTELLHSQALDIPQSTAFCPSGPEIAAILDSAERHPNQERFERHLAGCGYCQTQVAVLARFRQSNDEVQIPQTLLVKADRFGNQPVPRRFRHAPRWAAAAVVVLALATIATQAPELNRGAVDGPPTQVDPEPREIRNIDTAHRAPSVLSPMDGASIRPGELTVRWTQVPGSLYYDIRLVDAEGFLLWQDRVKQTSAELPEQLDLVSGERYFVRVDAYLAEAKSVSSSHVKFIYEEQD